LGNVSRTDQRSTRQLLDVSEGSTGEVGGPSLRLLEDNGELFVRSENEEVEAKDIL
jgi:hypothetical protein